MKMKVIPVIVGVLIKIPKKMEKVQILRFDGRNAEID